MQPIARETVVERRQPTVRWSAVFAGAAAATALWLFLQVLGMGFGLSAIDTDDAGSLRGVGIGTGIWSLIAPALALFVGGAVAARASRSYDRVNNGIHGLLTWALTTVLGVMVMFSIVSAVAGAAVSTGQAAVRGAGSVIGTAAGALDGDAMKTLGVDADDLLGPVNQRLREQGKPAVTADQLEAAGKDVIQRGLHEGRLDRELLVDRLAARTALDRRDAGQIADQIEARVASARTRVGEAADTAEKAALTAADRTGKLLLGLAASMLFSLIAAIGGAMLGLWWRDRQALGGGGMGRGEQRTQEMWTTREPGAGPTPGVIPPV